MEFAERAGNAQNDAAFQQWRGTRGIPQDHPVSINEYNRYQRHARQVGRPRWKARSTGDVRELKYQDYSFGIPTDAGMQFFTDKDGNYYRPEAVAQLAQAQLAGARVVEIDLTNAENLILVGNVVEGAEGGDPMLGQLLRDMAGKKGARARALYDKENGDIVVLDNDRMVMFKGKVASSGDAAGALHALAADPARADIAGTAAGVAAGRSDNALENLDGAIYDEDTPQQFDVGNYTPPDVVPTTQAPITTINAEVVLSPGSDPRNLYAMYEEDGVRKMVTVPILSQTDPRDPKSPWVKVLEGNSRLQDFDEYKTAVKTNVAEGSVVPDDERLQREWSRHERKAKRSARRLGMAAKRARSGSISTGQGQVTAAGEWEAPPMKEVLPEDQEKAPETDYARAMRGGSSAEPTEPTTDYGASLQDGRDWRLAVSDVDATDGGGLESAAGPDSQAALQQNRPAPTPYTPRATPESGSSRPAAAPLSSQATTTRRASMAAPTSYSGALGRGGPSPEWEAQEEYAAKVDFPAVLKALERKITGDPVIPTSYRKPTPILFSTPGPKTDQEQAEALAEEKRKEREAEEAREDS
jgi:hypothetical protein